MFNPNVAADGAIEIRTSPNTKFEVIHRGTDLHPIHQALRMVGGGTSLIEFRTGGKLLGRTWGDAFGAHHLRPYERAHEALFAGNEVEATVTECVELESPRPTALVRLIPQQIRTEHLTAGPGGNVVLPGSAAALAQAFALDYEDEVLLDSAFQRGEHVSVFAHRHSALEEEWDDHPYNGSLLSLHLSFSCLEDRERWKVDVYVHAMTDYATLAEAWMDWVRWPDQRRYLLAYGEPLDEEPEDRPAPVSVSGMFTGLRGDEESGFMMRAVLAGGGIR